MDWLPALYPLLQQRLWSHIPPQWEGLQSATAMYLGEELQPSVIPVLGSCKAVGGDPIEALDVAVAVLLAQTSLRLMDEIQDGDKVLPWSASRAWNFADAFKTLAFGVLHKRMATDLDRYHPISQIFAEGYLTVLAGQDRESCGHIGTWQDTWQTIGMKTGAAYATAAQVGAMVGTQNPEWINACRTYGYHLGLILQIFNDLEGIWEPEGVSDLAQGKLTLPLHYGLHCIHPDQQTLCEIVASRQMMQRANHIKEVLDKIDTRGYLVWVALQQREQALQALEPCPDEAGKTILAAHLTALFGDLERLTAPTFVPTQEPTGSPGLALREQFRIHRG